MCLCVLVCVNFEDEILLRGEVCKTGNFFCKLDDETDFTPLNLSREL